MISQSAVTKAKSVFKEAGPTGSETVAQLPKLSEALSITEGVALLERLQDIPTTTLFVTRENWQLLTLPEVLVYLQQIVATNPEQSAIPAMLSTEIKQAQLEAGTNTPLVSPLIEAEFKKHFIGRCEVGIHPDPVAPDKSDKKTYYFHRIEVDLTDYKVQAGQDPYQYFLQFMEQWLALRPLPHVATIKNVNELTLKLRNFPPAQITISLN
jgi:hypothetical protein